MDTKDDKAPTETLADAMDEQFEVRHLPAEVRDALVNRGHSYDDRMSAAQAFDEFCEWHGLIGWGRHLRETMAGLAELEAPLAPAR